MAETQEKEPQAEAVDKEALLDQQPVVPNGRSGRMWAVAVSSLALVVSGAVAIYTSPNYDLALPNFSRIAELLPRGAAPSPDPVTLALTDIQSSQQRNGDTLLENGAVLQRNTAILQQNAAILESLKQGSMSQQMNLKIISSQLASLIARVDALQNAVSPLTTSSIPQPGARSIPQPGGRAGLARTLRKTTSRLPNEPLGPVSVRGAPLNPAPAPARQRFSAG